MEVSPKMASYVLKENLPRTCKGADSGSRENAKNSKQNDIRLRTIYPKQPISPRGHSPDSPYQRGLNISLHTPDIYKRGRSPLPELDSSKRFHIFYSEILYIRPQIIRPRIRTDQKRFSNNARIVLTKRRKSKHDNEKEANYSSLNTSNVVPYISPSINAQSPNITLIQPQINNMTIINTGPLLKIPPETVIRMAQ